MKKSRLLTLTIFTLISMFIMTGKVNAADYTFNMTAYNVTEACDLSKGGQTCFNKAIRGQLNSQKIDNGVVAANQIIMITINAKANISNSALSYFRLKVPFDTNKVTYYDDGTGKVTATASKSTSKIGGVKYEYTIFPSNSYYDEENDETIYETDWTSTINVYDGYALTVTDSGDAQMPFEKTTDSAIYGMFFKVNSDIKPGTDINFDISFTNPNKSTISDASFNELAGVSEFPTLKLSVLSSVSTDGTLKELKAMGNNSIDYLSGKFVPSSNNDLEYNLIVPNSVNSITFTGSATDSKVKGITGLDTANSLDVGDNSFNITVVAESGDSTIYKINVKRLSNDATLSNITTTNGVSFGTLQTGKTTYDVTVPYKTTSTTATATTTHSDATIQSGLGTWNIPTDNTTNKKTTFPVLVKAENCKYTTTDVPGNTCDTKTYNFNITRTAPSKNVNLSDLTVDGVTVPGFNPATIEYTLTDVPYSKSSLVIGATVADPLNDNISGTGTKTIAVGPNTYKVVVTGEDGTTSKEYTIKVKRLSNNKYLSALNITSSPQGTMAPSTLTPTFGGEYKYSYGPTVTRIDIAATVQDTDKAKVRIVNTTDGASEELVAKKLNSASVSVGTNIKTLKVIVTPEDEAEDEMEYTITLERTKSTNNDLSSLSITPGTITNLDTPFNPNKTEYTATVDPDVTRVDVSAVLADPANSTLGTITGNEDLQFGGGNIIRIPVKSESGSTKTYTITVTRKEYNIATLDEIRVGIGGATPSRISGFNKNTFEYNLYTEASPLDYNTDKISIEYTETPDVYTTVTGDSGANLNVNTGANQYKITVRSQDNSVTNVYKINVYRQKNTDKSTHSVTVAGIEAVQDATDTKRYNVTLPNSKTSITPSEVVVEIGKDATLLKQTTTLPLQTKTDNIFTYSITSESGDTENYQIYITRESSSNATIRTVNLRLDGETTPSRSCTFIAPSKECTIEVPTNTTAYFLEPIMDSTQRVEPVVGTKYTMDPNLVSDSEQTRPITIYAEDGTPENYTIKVKRAKSTVAYLKSLTLTDITGGKNENIPVAFNEETTTYNVIVNGDVTDIKIEAEKKDSKSTIDKTLPHTMTINNYEEANSFVIRVTAEDGTTSIPYTINITRKAKTDATLRDLRVEGTTLSDFASTKINYTYTDVAYNKTSIDIGASVNDDIASNILENAIIKEVKVNGNNVSITSDTDITTSIPLRTGSNTIEVVVAAQNRSTTKAYTIVINRAKNQDTGVSKVEVYFEGAFHEALWNNTKNAYEITVPYNTITAQGTNASTDGYVRVTPNEGATSTDALATVTMGTTNLVTDDPVSGNVNTHSFNVQAEDSSVSLQVYNILITRTKNNRSELQRVNLYKNDESNIYAYCSVDSGSTECTIGVDADTTSFRLEGKIPASSKNAQVVFSEGGIEKTSFTLADSEDTKEIIATVTAEDGTSTPYRITILRSASANFYPEYIKTNANQEDSTNLVEIEGFDKTNPGPYTLEVLSTQSSITISAKTMDSKATLTLLGDTSTVTGDVTGNDITFTKNLEYGKNIIEIKAQAQDSRMGNTYKIEVTRKENTDAELSMIYIDGQPINDYLPSGVTFNKSTYEYELVELPYNTDKINITVNNSDGEYGTSENTGLHELQTKYYGKVAPVETSDEYVNTIKVIGVAHDGSKQEYTLSVKRTPSDSTLISKVIVTYDGAPHEATCDLSNKRCTITVPNSVDKLSNSNVTVVPIAGRLTTDALATASVTTTSLSTKNETSVPIRVTAEDGTTTGSSTNRDYELIVTRAKSSDARLKTLAIYDETLSTIIGTLTPGFNATTDSDQTFTVTIPQNIDKINIKAEPNDSNAHVTGDGVVTLLTSEDTIIVNSTSEDSSKTIKYTLNIKREKNSNVNIDTNGGISVIGSDGVEYNTTITPPINSNTREYTVNVPNTVHDATVKITPASNLAHAAITTTLTSDDVTNPDGDEDTADAKFKLTTNTTKVVKFEIVSESGSKMEYTLNIVVAPKSDNTLSSLKYTLTNGTETELLTEEALQNDTTTFDLGNVAYNVSQITISAIANDGAEITGDIGTQSILVRDEGNTYRIIVTSEDGLSKTYTIKVKRDKNNDATLKDLSINGYALNETFVPSNKNNINYSVTVSETTTSLSASDFVARPTDSNATVTLIGGENEDGTLDLPTSGSYDYRIRVEASDGTELIYTINVIRPKSSNAYLQSVNLSGATLEPNNINHSDTKYTLKVSNGTNTIQIKGIPEANTSEVIYSDSAIYDSETGLYTYSDIYEGQQIVLKVHPEIGTDKTYIFTVSFIKSNTATLSDLSVSGYTFEEGLFNGATDYNINTIPKVTEELVVNVTPTDAYAKNIEYFHDNVKVPDCDGERSCHVPINSGLDGGTIKVRVTAQDDTTREEYRIYYKKVGDNDATLKTLVPSVGTLDNTFNSGTDTYILTVSEDDDSVTFEVVASQPTTTISSNGNTVRGSLDFTVSNLTPGATTPVVIKTKAEDGTEKTYTVNVFRPNRSGNNDSSLSSLTVKDKENKDYPLNEEFKPGTLGYSIEEIPYSVKELVINAETNVNTSTPTYKVNGVAQATNTVIIPDTAGSGTIVVEVTAEDGSKTNYEINYRKAAPSENFYLESLEVGRASLNEKFDKLTGKYTINIPETQSSIDLTLVPEDANSTITVNGEDYVNGTKITKNISKGTSTINIIVTSESGFTKAYQITVTREDNSGPVNPPDNPDDPSQDEKITSKVFGHTIDDDYIRTVAEGATAIDMKDQLDNDNSKLEIWSADDSSKINDGDVVGTGMIVKLIVGGKVVDSKVIIVKGDVDGSGEIDVFDVTDMIKHIVGDKELTGPYLVAADVFQDEGDEPGMVDIFDTTDVIFHIVGDKPLIFK